MNNYFRLFGIVVLTALCWFSLTGCGDDDNGTSSSSVSNSGSQSGGGSSASGGGTSASESSASGNGTSASESSASGGSQSGGTPTLALEAIGSPATAYRITGIGTATLSGGALVIPDTYEGLPITEIAQNAFYYNNNGGIASVTIGANVTSIGATAFRDCENLASITFAGASQLASIGNSAFADCSSLESITLPAGVISIGNSVFNNCASLTSVTLGGGITIGNDAFPEGADGAGGGTLQAAYGIGGAGEYTRAAGGSTWAKVVPTAGLAYELISSGANNGTYRVRKGTVTTGAVVIASTYNDLPVTEIGGASDSYTAGAFYGVSGITSVSIPASVKVINQYAFYDCTGITAVTFAAGSQLTTIGNYVFDGCIRLDNFTMPAGVATIGIEAFDVCDILSSITIPASVTNIGNKAFTYCPKLTSVTFEAAGITIGDNAFPNPAWSDGDSDNSLRTLYNNATTGGAGTYTRPTSASSGARWTKQP